MPQSHHPLGWDISLSKKYTSESWSRGVCYAARSRLHGWYTEHLPCSRHSSRLMRCSHKQSNWLNQLLSDWSKTAWIESSSQGFLEAGWRTKRGAREHPKTLGLEHQGQKASAPTCSQQREPNFLSTSCCSDNTLHIHCWCVDGTCTGQSVHKEENNDLEQAGGEGSCEIQFLRAVRRYSSKWVISCAQTGLSTCSPEMKPTTWTKHSPNHDSRSQSAPRCTAVGLSCLQFWTWAKTQEELMPMRRARKLSREETDHSCPGPTPACSLWCRLILDLVHSFIKCVYLFKVSRNLSPPNHFIGTTYHW